MLTDVFVANVYQKMFSIDYVYSFMYLKLYCKNKENKLLADIKDMSTLQILASGMNFKKRQRYEMLRHCGEEEFVNSEERVYSSETDVRINQKAKKKNKKKVKSYDKKVNNQLNK
jgi:hypothetical protein